MKSVSLFAGIGGFDLGFARHGIEPTMFCENNRSATLVLQNRFPGVRVRADICELKNLPRGVEVMTAGFPCQDLSQVGTRRGLDGERSGLVSHVFRLLEGRRVPWVVIENVPFMLHIGGGAAMRSVIGQLEALNYRWAYRVVDSGAFGLPQRRRRVIIVATRDGDPRGVLHADEAGPPVEPLAVVGRTPIGFYWTEGNKGVGWAVDAVPTLKGGSGHGIPSAPAILLPDGDVVVPTVRAGERLQGFETDWTDVAGIVSDRERWRMIGNAVNVLLADWIGSRLVNPGAPLTDGTLFTGAPWPAAAYGHEGKRFRVELSAFPEANKRQSLLAVLKKDRALLSAKATRGFLNRLLRSKLRQRDDKAFVSRLNAHIDAQVLGFVDAAE